MQTERAFKMLNAVAYVGTLHYKMLFKSIVSA